MVTLAKESYFFIYTQGGSSPWLALELPVFWLTILSMSFYPRGHKMAVRPPSIAYKYQIGWLRTKVKKTCQLSLPFYQNLLISVQNWVTWPSQGVRKLLPQTKLVFKEKEKNRVWTGNRCYPGILKLVPMDLQSDTGSIHGNICTNVFMCIF